MRKIYKIISYIFFYCNKKLISFTFATSLVESWFCMCVYKKIKKKLWVNICHNLSSFDLQGT